MSTQNVTISLDNNNKPTASPDPVNVNAGDTVVWQLGTGLHWPQASPSNISRVAAAGSSDLLGNSLQWVPPSAPGTQGTIQGTIASNAAPDDFEKYSATVSQSGVVELVLTTHYESGAESFDPKIQVNPRLVEQ